MQDLILIRHGQSVWNAQNLFTGWADVELTEKGQAEAKIAAQKLKDAGHEFHYVYTSLLKRAIKTSWIILEEMDLMGLPQERNWRLNERHYGGLQGKNKIETAQEFGEEQVKIWRRSFTTPPPAPSLKEEFKYPFLCQDLESPPEGESLSMTCERVIPYWENTIRPRWEKGEKILIVAHGNSLRGLLKHLKSINDEDIIGLELPTGVPIECKMNTDGLCDEFKLL